MTRTHDSQVLAARRQLFIDFTKGLEAAGIDYVILSGCDAYPERIDSDIDFMVRAPDFARLPALFSCRNWLPGASLLQMLEHESSACYFVFARQVGERLAYLHPDASADYRRRGRLWLRCEDVLASRRLHPAGFWVPSAAVDFEYRLIKRIDKGNVDTRHLERLASSMCEDRDGCLAALDRLIRGPARGEITRAIQERDAEWFVRERHRLRKSLRRSAAAESLPGRTLNALADVRRIARRIRHPTGLILAVLGPDGCGKSTVIQHLEDELLPAFRRTRRFHLRPRFGVSPAGSSVIADPHGQTARSKLTSSLKALVFAVDYWIGWATIVWPAKLRSTLVLFDRYYHDILVDPLRYRMPAATRVPHWLAPLVPRGDLWLVLEAPAPVLVARKGEITLSAASQLSAGYAALASRYPAVRQVTTDGALEEALAHVVSVVCDELALRVSRTAGACR